MCGAGASSWILYALLHAGWWWWEKMVQSLSPSQFSNEQKWKQYVFQQKSLRRICLAFCMHWPGQQSQQSTGLGFHTPAPSGLPFEVGPSAISEAEVAGRAGNGDRRLRKLLFLLICSYFLLLNFLWFFHNCIPPHVITRTGNNITPVTSSPSCSNLEAGFQAARRTLLGMPTTVTL